MTPSMQYRANSESPSVEDYLVSIYRLLIDKKKVNTGELAQKMGVSAASTSAMFKRLQNRGLINYNPYEGVDLTANGKEIALHVLRRHRIIERFLTDTLNIGWERVDNLAHQMEHALPEEVLDRLDQWLGEPETCPHGHPIPLADGKIKDQSGTTIDKLRQGQKATVLSVAEDNPKLLQYLKECGLVPGTVFELSNKNSIDGTMQIKIGAEEQFIGPRIVSAVSVLPYRIKGSRLLLSDLGFPLFCNSSTLACSASIRSMICR